MTVVPLHIRNVKFSFEVPIHQNKRLSIIDVIVKCHRSDINDCSLANLMFQNEVKQVVLIPSSTNLGINKEVTHNTRQNNKIVGTQYRQIPTIIIIIVIIKNVPAGKWKI